MPHYFSVKRSCLEDTYCEQFNRESVHLVDIKRTIRSRSLARLASLSRTGPHHELDVIALATGFLKGVQQVALPDDQVDVHGRQHPGQGVRDGLLRPAAPTSTQKRFTKALEDMEGGVDMVEDKGIKSML
ncbi:hypothetical protein MY4038_007460 [Beauveria bassiana]